MMDQRDRLFSIRQQEDLEVERSRTRVHKKKTLLTMLIVLSYLCVGCYRAIPGPTLVNLAHLVKEDIHRMPLIFTVRSLGYIVGCIVGGLSFDSLLSSTYRHFFIVVIKSVAAATAIGTPFCRNITSLSITFFVAGICLSALDIGFSIYLLDIWKVDSNPYLQCFNLFYGIGAFLGPVLARAFIEEEFHSNETNTTEPSPSLENIAHLPNFMYAYLIICFMYALCTLFWVVLCMCPTVEIIAKRQRHFLARPPSTSFIIFASLTSCILFFIIGSTEMGYQNMLATFGFAVYKMSTVGAADLTAVFWGFYALGAFIAIFVARKFHPFCMIIFLLLLEVCGGLIILFLAENHQMYLALGNVFFGLGASALFPTTILWLETYIIVTHKILGLLLSTGECADLVIPEILGKLLEFGHKGFYSFLLALPAFYFIVFFIQCFCFFTQGEKRILAQPAQAHSSAFETIRRPFPIFLRSSQQLPLPDPLRTSGTQTLLEDMAASKGDPVILTPPPHSRTESDPQSSKRTTPTVTSQHCAVQTDSIEKIDSSVETSDDDTAKSKEEDKDAESDDTTHPKDDINEELIPTERRGSDDKRKENDKQAKSDDTKMYSENDIDEESVPAKSKDFDDKPQDDDTLAKSDTSKDDSNEKSPPAKRSSSDDKPKENDTPGKSDDTQTKPDDTQTKPDDTQTKPDDTQSKPEDTQAKSDDTTMSSKDNSNEESPRAKKSLSEEITKENDTQAKSDDTTKPSKSDSNVGSSSVERSDSEEKSKKDDEQKPPNLADKFKQIFGRRRPKK